MMFGLGFTYSTLISPGVALLWLEMLGVTSERAIFWMTADLARPVPAARAPAFWAKNTSSVAGYLLSIER